MESISKQDIIDAYHKKKGKRTSLLFNYYKDTLFFKGLTSEFISQKISQDLGIEITPSMIYKINLRIIKPNIQLKSFKKGYQKPIEPQQETVKYKNADEYPKKDPFNGALDDL